MENKCGDCEYFVPGDYIMEYEFSECYVKNVFLTSDTKACNIFDPNKEK